MPRRSSQRKNRSRTTRSGLSAYLRRPVVQIAILVVVAVIVYLIAVGGGETNSLASSVSANQGYQMVQDGAFLLDVRTQDEWNQYHVPGATLIPLDQLQNRLSEVPKDKQIVVICHSGNRSQQGRDILLSAGFQATSVEGGLLEWYANKLPFEGSPPQ